MTVYSFRGISFLVFVVFSDNAWLVSVCGISVIVPSFLVELSIWVFLLDTSVPVYSFKGYSVFIFVFSYNALLTSFKDNSPIFIPVFVSVVGWFILTDWYSFGGKRDSILLYSCENWLLFSVWILEADDDFWL